MATVRCGISHKDTKHTDKCSNNKTKTTQKQTAQTTDIYFFQNNGDIALGYELDDRGFRVRFPAGAGKFFS
jgi:hypothetical protein